MGTIVQEYGPIYGEVVNGTVSGRPNGSVYVPPYNTVTLTVQSGTKISLSGTYVLASKPVEYKTEMQDLSSNVQIQIFEDASCTTLYAVIDRGAGTPTESFYAIGRSSTAPVTGQSYYVRAQLMNNGVPIATSTNVEEVEGA